MNSNGIDVNMAVLLMYLYRIENASAVMASRHDTQAGGAPSSKRIAWSTIQTLSNLIHSEFHDILHDIFDPRRRLILVATVLNMYDLRSLSSGLGNHVPPVVPIDHRDQQKGMDLAFNMPAAPFSGGGSGSGDGPVGSIGNLPGIVWSGPQYQSQHFQQQQRQYPQQQYSQQQQQQQQQMPPPPIPQVFTQPPQPRQSFSPFVNYDPFARRTVPSSTFDLPSSTFDLQSNPIDLQSSTIDLQSNTIGLQSNTISLQSNTIDLTSVTPSSQVPAVTQQEEELVTLESQAGSATSDPEQVSEEQPRRSKRRRVAE